MSMAASTSLAMVLLAATAPSHAQHITAIEQHPLKNTHVHFSGFSESRVTVARGATDALNCSSRPRFGGSTTLVPGGRDSDLCRDDPRWTQELTRKDAGFLATCRQANSSTMEDDCGDGNALSFRWKSVANYPSSDSEVDAYLSARVADTASPRRRVVALYSVGPHHFASEPGHVHTMEFVLLDTWTPPSSWMLRWFVGMEALFRRIVQLRKEKGICVLWKTNNIGPRVSGGEHHHPSSKGGWHDHLNTFAAAIARSHDVPVVDLTSTTMANSSRSEPVMQKNKNAPTGVTNYDMYHGYKTTAIWAKVAHDIATYCPSVWGHKGKW